MTPEDAVLVLLWLATCALFALIGWASRKPRTSRERRLERLAELTPRLPTDLLPPPLPRVPGDGSITIHYNQPLTEDQLGRVNGRKGRAP